MSFVDQFNVNEPPRRVCPDKFGGLFAVFTPELLEGHDRAGYVFRPNACLDVVSYDPDYCVPGDLKMEPGTYGPPKEAVLGMIQTAINCTMGVSMDKLREDARQALSDKIERAVGADFVALIAATAVAGPGGEPGCALANAAQFLNDSGECGVGLIAGPVNWFVQLRDALVWQAGKGYHTDYVGNIVIPHTVNNNTVYALDAAVEIKISDVQILDETMPGQRTVNDRVVRAEQLYTIAVDSCEIGSFPVTPCT